MSITINGEALEEFLLKKVPKATKRLRFQEIHERSRSRRRYPWLGRNIQRLDTTPGECRTFTREEVWMVRLQQAYVDRETEMIEESKVEKPNRTKLILCALAHPTHLAVTEICGKIEDATGITPPGNAVAGALTTLLKPENQKPLRHLIEIDRSKGRNAYRYLLPAAELRLVELYQLSLKKGMGNFSLRDAQRKVPGLKELLSPKQKEVEKVIPRGSGVTDVIGGDTGIRVHVEFGPNRILFGLDNGSGDG